MKTQEIIVVGGGLVGPLLAIYLAKKGFSVELYEKQEDARLNRVQVESGRSINLVLSTRGIYALNELGVFDGLVDHLILMKGRMIHPESGGAHFTPYSSLEPAIFSISRGELHDYMIDCCEMYPNIKIHFNEVCVHADFKENCVLFKNRGTGQVRQVPLTMLFATDGIFSNVRRSMIHTPEYNYVQQIHEHAYKEILLPPHSDGSYKIDKYSFHVWPREDYMFQAQANLDGSFTCTLSLKSKGDPSFESLTDKAAVDHFFRSELSDLLDLIPDLSEQFLAHPMGYFATIKCSPWNFKDKALLLGDAAHAIGPFYGQGMNSGFEDCSILNRCIDEYGEDWEKIFVEFDKRRADTDILAALERENFFELRSFTNDPKYLLKKELEIQLEKAYPGEFYSKFSLVVLHKIPYALAADLGREQDRILMELCEHKNGIEDFDICEVKKNLDTATKKIDRSALDYEIKHAKEYPALQKIFAAEREKSK